MLVSGRTQRGCVIEEPYSHSIIGDIVLFLLHVVTLCETKYEGRCTLYVQGSCWVLHG